MPGSFIPQGMPEKEPIPFSNGYKTPGGPPPPHPQLIEQRGPPAFFGREEIVQLNEPFWAAYFVITQPATIYEPKEEKFYSYEEETGLFVNISEATIQVIISDLILDASRQWGGFAGLNKFRNDKHLRGIIKALKGQTEKAGAFRAVKNAIHLQNCVLEFAQDGTFTKHPFSPKYRSRSRSEISYDPTADCAEFKKSILPQFASYDQEAFQKYSGQCLLGRNATQTILILDGVGGAGKGAAVNIIKGVVGPQIAYELRTNLLDRQFEIGRMSNKTLLIGSDVKADFLSHDAASFLKKLTGGDLLEGERKRSNDENPLDGDFNVMITSNSRLRVRLEGDDSAWERRLIILRLETPYTEKRIEKFHELLLQKEGPGILNWCLQGLEKLFQDMENGQGTFLLSEQQKKRVKSLLRESDSLRIFFQSHIVGTSDNSDLTSEEIIAKYVEHCRDCDWVPLSLKKAESGVRELMLEVFGQGQSGSIQREGKSKRGYRHVRFRKDNEKDPPSVIA